MNYQKVSFYASVCGRLKSMYEEDEAKVEGEDDGGIIMTIFIMEC